jgi:hypothetical protein
MKAQVVPPTGPLFSEKQPSTGKVSAPFLALLATCTVGRDVERRLRHLLLTKVGEVVDERASRASDHEALRIVRSSNAVRQRIPPVGYDPFVCAGCTLSRKARIRKTFERVVEERYARLVRTRLAVATIERVAPIACRRSRVIGDVGLTRCKHMGRIQRGYTLPQWLKS